MGVIRTFNQNKLKPGSSNGICDICGFKFKREDLRKRWDDAVVCRKHWESKHPSLTYNYKSRDEGAGGKGFGRTDSATETGGTDVGGATFPPALVIDPNTWDTQILGTAFSYQFTAEGASPNNITWTLSSGSLPSGLGLAPDGKLTGVFTISETANFTLLATASDGRTDTESFSISTTSLSDLILATSELWGYYPLQDDGSDLGGGKTVEEVSGNNDTTPTHDLGNYGRIPSHDTAPSWQVSGPGSITYGVSVEPNKALQISNTPSLGTGETYLGIFGAGILAEFSVEVCFKRNSLTDPGYDAFIVSHGAWISSGTPQPMCNASIMLQTGSQQLFHYITPRTAGNALGGPVVTDTNWHHVVITHSTADGVDEIYYDGSLYSSSGTPQVFSTALGGGPYYAGFGSLYLDANNNTRQSDITLSQSAWYRKRLSAADVTQRYNAIGL